jgi:UDP-glucose 4-epimerase
MGMRVLVTGGTGFTGRALLRTLAKRGDTVYAVHRPGSAAPDPVEGVEPIGQDLSAPLGPSLPDVVDAVIHLAQSRRFREFPDGAADVFEVNAAAAVRLLEWARVTRAKSFVYASSGAVYAPGSAPVEETATLAPSNFYAVSKRCGELACEQFRGMLKAHILRFFFIYGPGQKGMFVPSIIDRIRRGDEVSLAGEEGIRLNPVYVDDAVRAIAGVLDSPESMTLNVAGADVVSLRELSDQAGKLLGTEPRFAVGDEAGTGLLGSVKRLGEAGLGPRVPFAEGLERTIAASAALR